jgi:hypothetical protein
MVLEHEHDDVLDLGKHVGTSRRLRIWARSRLQHGCDDPAPYVRTTLAARAQPEPRQAGDSTAEETPSAQSVTSADTPPAPRIRVATTVTARRRPLHTRFRRPGDYLKHVKHSEVSL